MIPILFDDGERNFISNGIGRLADCLSCKVTEERNGIYECEFTYPITGERYADIEEGQIIYCIHDDTKTPQAFIIYARSAPINGIVTFYAHHISYKLRQTVVKPFTATSVTDALDKIGINTIPLTDFTFWTDKSSVGDFAITEPRAVRGVLGGEDGSILDVYGKGDYEWDMFIVKLYHNRGTDSGIEIRYGKNLINLTNQTDSSNTYNAIVPFWKGTDSDGAEVLVTLPEGAIIYSGATRRKAYLTDENLVVIREENGIPLEVTYREVIAIPYDMSSVFSEQPTEEELRTAAESYLESSDGWVKKQNLTVDFVQMWQTEEYKDYAPLQKARLCDTVSVYYPELGVVAEKKKVIRTVYNVLTERYDEIELGDVQYTFADVVAQQMLEEVPTRSMMEDAIQHATEMISGGLGGYVVLKPNANGVPEEILIMDSPDIDSAVNVIRMNKNGIGFSTNGYSGTFTTAWTIDGNFVADFITSGTLNANLIKAGVLSDVGGNTSLNLTTGVLNINKGSINLGSGKFTVNDSGALTATDVDIGGFKLTSAVDGKYAFVSDYGNYRTWIRGATSGDGGDTWVFSAQQKSGGSYVGNFYVTASGEIHANPSLGSASFDVDNSGLKLTYGSYDLIVDSQGILGWYGSSQRLTVDSARGQLSYGNYTIDVDSNGAKLDYLQSGTILTYVGVTSSEARMYSQAADIICNSSGLTLKTGRSSTVNYGNLYITSDGIAYRAREGSSSRKLKKDICPVCKDELNPDHLYDAKVIQFKFRDEELDEDDANRGKDLIGFIVEDLDEIYPVAVHKEKEDDSKTWVWSPHMMIPPMLKLIQSQKKEINELHNEIGALKQEIETVKEVLKC